MYSCTVSVHILCCHLLYLITYSDYNYKRLKRYMFIFRISSRNVLLTWATPLHDNHAPIYNYRIFVRYVQQYRAVKYT